MNPRPRDYDSPALPLSYPAIYTNDLVFVWTAYMAGGGLAVKAAKAGIAERRPTI